jgi:hypothetical protein
MCTLLDWLWAKGSIELASLLWQPPCLRIETYVLRASWPACPLPTLPLDREAGLSRLSCPCWAGLGAFSLLSQVFSQGVRFSPFSQKISWGLDGFALVCWTGLCRSPQNQNHLTYLTGFWDSLSGLCGGTDIYMLRSSDLGKACPSALSSPYSFFVVVVVRVALAERNSGLEQGGGKNIGWRGVGWNRLRSVSQ